jgi:aldehyde:ferredoxin oxidoreductase
VKSYAGKLLRVDLSKSELETISLDAAFYRKYLGGHGFIAHFLLTEMPTGADPLGPDNVLIFAGGTFSGVPIAGGGRNAVGAKSPLTGGYGCSEVGGYFGAELAKAGYDAIIIKGKAPAPVYIHITEHGIEFRSAASIWGKTVKDSFETLQAELDTKHLKTAMIGPAGEKLVRYACIINDLKHAAGRTGLGAVMGSKNLKAITVHTSQRKEVAEEDLVKELSQWMTSEWPQKAQTLHEHGSAGNVPLLQHIGALPTHNHTINRFDGAETISGQHMSETILTAREGCFACAIRCKRKVQVDKAEFQVDGLYGGPEYETIGAFGSNCGVSDLELIAKANELCNTYGIDTISAGGMISFAMECFEKGLISDEMADGLELRFGNGEAMLSLVEKICTRKGIGDLLAETPETVIAAWGEETRDCFVGVKGQGLPMHEGRIRHGHAFGYAMSPTGADHMHNYWDHEIMNDPTSESAQGLGLYEQVDSMSLSSAKVQAYAIGSLWPWVHNMVCNCMYVPWTKEQMIQLINAVTGWRVNQYELMKTSERALVLARLFNLREGLTSEDDHLPERYFEPVGKLAGIDRNEFEQAKETYYLLMGWSRDGGIPTEAKLLDLGISWAAEYLSQLPSDCLK